MGWGVAALLPSGGRKHLVAPFGGGGGVEVAALLPSGGREYLVAPWGDRKHLLVLGGGRGV